MTRENSQGHKYNLGESTQTRVYPRLAAELAPRGPIDGLGYRIRKDRVADISLDNQDGPDLGTAAIAKRVVDEHHVASVSIHGLSA